MDKSMWGEVEAYIRDIISTYKMTLESLFGISITSQPTA